MDQKINEPKTHNKRFTLVQPSQIVYIANSIRYRSEKAPSLSLSHLPSTPPLLSFGKAQEQKTKNAKNKEAVSVKQTEYANIKQIDLMDLSISNRLSKYELIALKY